MDDVIVLFLLNENVKVGNDNLYIFLVDFTKLNLGQVKILKLAFGQDSKFQDADVWLRF